jgi:hypothetical protein
MHFYALCTRFERMQFACTFADRSFLVYQENRFQINQLSRRDGAGARESAGLKKPLLAHL